MQHIVQQKMNQEQQKKLSVNMVFSVTTATRCNKTVGLGVAHPWLAGCARASLGNQDLLLGTGVELLHSLPELGTRGGSAGLTGESRGCLRALAALRPSPLAICRPRGRLVKSRSREFSPKDDRFGALNFVVWTYSLRAP